MDARSSNGQDEFEHRMRTVHEETEGLTEEFKAKLGLNISQEATLEDSEFNNDVFDKNSQEFKFENFIKKYFKPDVVSSDQLPLPFLSNTPVTMNSKVLCEAIRNFCHHGNEDTHQETSQERRSILQVVSDNLSVESSKSKGKDIRIGCPPHHTTILMQFIVSYGILCPSLRNEIYTQLCVKVRQGAETEEVLNAWRLQLLCAGCFVPDKMMISYYLSFLKETSHESVASYATQIINLLKRTNNIGTRCHPPNSLEFKAAKALKKMMLPVLLADERVINVKADASTTACDVCLQISKAINLRDLFGFAVYISVGEKISSLGNGQDRIMDAISECEQTREKWHLLLSKEIFTPWHDAEADIVATNLIYIQVVKSVQNGHFKFNSEEDLSRFLARICYVEMGAKVTEDVVREKLGDLLPRTVKREEKWSRMIYQAFQKMGFKEEKWSREHVKWGLVEGSQSKWPLQFAAMFEVEKVSTRPPLSTNHVVLAVSCRGVFLIEEPYKLLCGLHYYEIIEVTLEREEKQKDKIVIMTTNGTKWVFKSNKSPIVVRLVSSFIDGLRRRSRWAVVIKNFYLRDHSTKQEVFVRQGEIVELVSGGTAPENHMVGKCQSSQQTLCFPFDCVYILPSIKKPPQDFLDIFSHMSEETTWTLSSRKALLVLKNETLPRSSKQSII